MYDLLIITVTRTYESYNSIFTKQAERKTKLSIPTLHIDLSDLDLASCSVTLNIFFFVSCWINYFLVQLHRSRQKNKKIKEKKNST